MVSLTFSLRCSLTQRWKMLVAMSDALHAPFKHEPMRYRPVDEAATQ